MVVRIRCHGYAAERYDPLRPLTKPDEQEGTAGWQIAPMGTTPALMPQSTMLDLANLVGEIIPLPQFRVPGKHVGSHGHSLSAGYTTHTASLALST